MARVDVPIVGAALCLIPVSRYNDSAPTRPVNGPGKPSGNATRWPPTLIIKPTSETRGRLGKPGIATTGASIAKDAPITMNSIFKFFSLAIRAALIFQVLHSIGATHNHGVAFG